MTVQEVLKALGVQEVDSEIKPKDTSAFTVNLFTVGKLRCCWNQMQIDFPGVPPMDFLLVVAGWKPVLPPTPWEAKLMPPMNPEFPDDPEMFVWEEKDFEEFVEWVKEFGDLHAAFLHKHATMRGLCNSTE